MIEYVSGIKIIVKKAGIATAILSQSMLFTEPIIDAPIRINTGEIAAIGTDATIGATNSDKAKHNAANTAVNPVLPPTSIPALLST